MPTPQADSPPTPIPDPRSLIPQMAAEPQNIRELSRALRARHTTAEAIVDACLERIAERNPTLNAFITVFDDDARERDHLDRAEDRLVGRVLRIVLCGKGQSPIFSSRRLSSPFGFWTRQTDRARALIATNGSRAVSTVRARRCSVLASEPR